MQAGKQGWPGRPAVTRVRLLALRPVTRLLGWLGVLPFVLLSLIVQGAMLDRDPVGGVTMVLCAGGETVEMIMAADGSLRHKTAEDELPHGDAPRCDWAAHAQPLLGAGGLAGPAMAAVVLPLRFSLRVPGHLRRMDLPVPSARDPPAAV
ncbi:hypothetical protein [Paracoccus halophilus]|uniref:hypothetical protein n=1 Tax=Paracoccus halophilus TaxID=376733 RepID=UPI001587F0CD|nr:hypothetical protein [Paracoccus halophilus]